MGQHPGRLVTADGLAAAPQITTYREQLRASRPQSSVWVSASAGSGKTKVLADRVLRLLLAGTEPHRILCLTFTRAAATEMQIRIRDRLGEWAVATDEVLSGNLRALTGDHEDPAIIETARGLFASFLDTPGGVRIQTIHAFCESLLGRFPLEADVVPHFTVMDERSARETLESIRNDVLTRAWKDQESDLGPAIQVITDWLNEDQFSQILRDIIQERGRIQRLVEAHGDLDGVLTDLRNRLGVGKEETESGLMEAACRDGAFPERDIRQAATALAAGAENDRKRSACIQRWLDDESARIDGFQDYALVYLTRDGHVRQRLATRQAQRQKPGLIEILDREARRVQAVLDRRKAVLSAEATSAVLRIATALTARFDSYKRNHALLDYDDLILKARALVERATPWVLYKLDGGLDHILIDEAQDSNADQWAVVRAITAEMFSGEGAATRSRTVFAVGDGKQSIFRFQGAAPEEFTRMNRYFETKCREAGKDWLQIPLEVSFRSTEAVLTAVDAVFETAEVREGVSESPIRHHAHRHGQAGQVELWPPMKEDRAGTGPPWQEVDRTLTAAQRLAGVIAGQIHAWISSGEQLESAGRAIRPGDIMVLVRRRSDLVRQIMTALRSRGIEVAGIDRMAVGEQLAVWDLVAVARFACLPEDNLNLAAILKGPLIGFDEEQLFEVCHGRGTRTVWQSLCARTDTASREAVAFLAEVMRLADMKPPFEFFAHILGPLGGRRRIVERLGDEADDPIDETLALALSYEQSNIPSLSGFLHWFEEGQEEIVRDMSQPVRDEVRILTVHGAKGLQAPIVILADTMQLPPFPSGLMWAAEDAGTKPLMLWTPRAEIRTDLAQDLIVEERKRSLEEYRRLLYVAMTRAEDRLYVCGHSGNQRRDEAWYWLVHDSLQPIAQPFDFSCMEEGQDGGDIRYGLRLQGIQKAQPDRRRREGKTQDQQLPLPDWAMRPAPEETGAMRPATATRLRNDLEPTVISPLGHDQGKAFQRGLLIHALLQFLPALAEDRRRAAARIFLERPVHALDGETVDSILDETLAVLGHPDYRSLFGSASRAEVPIVGRVGDVQVSGRIDRLLVLDDVVRIVDYKTNRPRPAEPSAIPVVYLRQMAAYHAILSQIFRGRNIECFLLWTDGPVLMTLDPELLGPHLP